MSTILKSLKKLEQENQGVRSVNPNYAYGGPGSLKLQGGKGRWIQNPWFRRSLLIAVILGLGASSIYFYNQSKSLNKIQARLDSQERHQPKSTQGKTIARKPPKTVPPKADAIAPDIKKQAPRSVPPSVNKVRGSNRMTSAPPTARRSEQPMVSNNQREGKTSVDSRPRKPVAKEDQNPSHESVAQRRTQPQTLPRAKSTKPAARTPATTRSPTPDQLLPKAKERQPQKQSSESFDNVPTLAGGQLKVHAIVWSPVREDRMAVINSRILYEGDAMDGYTLVAIRPDDVVVRKDSGGRYRVIFGHP